MPFTYCRRAKTLATIQMMTPRAASEMRARRRQKIFLGRVRKHQQRLRGDAANTPTEAASRCRSSCRNSEEVVMVGKKFMCQAAPEE